MRSCCNNAIKAQAKHRHRLPVNSSCLESGDALLSVFLPMATAVLREFGLHGKASPCKRWHAHGHAVHSVHCGSCKRSRMPQ
eukprot:5440585-Lingulodinium_polyedra.AAC.1